MIGRPLALERFIEHAFQRTWRQKSASRAAWAVAGNSIWIVVMAVLLCVLQRLGQVRESIAQQFFSTVARRGKTLNSRRE